MKNRSIYGEVEQVVMLAISLFVLWFIAVTLK